MRKQSQPYRLGVDIGTSSVAWGAMALDGAGNPTHMITGGMAIFGEPVEPKELKLKNEDRRKARLMRRQLARKRARIAKLLRIGERLGVTVADLAAAHRRMKRTHDLWNLRTKALDQRVELPELMLVLLRMAKNRGYWGREPSPNKKGDLGLVGKGIQQTKQLKEQTHARTIAEALVKSQTALPQEQRRFRKRVEGGHYVMRSDIAQEFELILDQQARHHPVLSASLAAVFGDAFVQRLQRDRAKEPKFGSHEFWGYVPETVREALRRAIFHQRQLKGFKDKIGACPYVPTDRRVVAAHPAFQLFRIEKLLGDLGWGERRHAASLSVEQKEVIRGLLMEKETVKFGAIYKALEQAGCMQPDGLTLNFHTSRREHLVGHSTRHVLRRLKLLEQFEAMSEKQQNAVFAALSDDVNAPEAWGVDDARERIVADCGSEVAAFIDLLDQANEGLDRLNAMEFKAQRVRYGATALRALAETMRREGLGESEAVAKLYPEAGRGMKASGTLPEVGKLDIRSPVVVHALEQTRRALGDAVRRLGRPTAMVVELSRPFKSSLEERNETDSRQRRQERENEEARAAILGANCRVSRDSILRYKLWIQQKKRCPYSGQAILSIEEALSGAKFEIEHIVPKRLHGVGNRFQDVVLASKRFNALKGAEETPYLAATHPRNAGKWDWAQTEQAIKAIERESGDFRRKARLILDKTPFRPEGMDDDEFVDRQLQDTQWIGRVVHGWCRHLCDDVTVVRGGLTAALRRAWQLDSVLPEVREAEGKHQTAKARSLFYKPNPYRDGEVVFEKRCDHRQHLIDACVIALSERRHYQAMVRARNNPKGAYAPPECSVPSLRAHLVKVLTGYEVWHVPDRLVSGLIFDQEPFALGADGKTLFKKGKKANRTFNDKVDRVVRRTDRHGREHLKAIVKAEAACARVTPDGWNLLNISDFRKEFLKGDKNPRLVIPENARLIFKNDLLAVPGKGVWRVAQLKDQGICCVPSSETAQFDELKGTGIQTQFSKPSDLWNARVLRHPAEVASVVKARKAMDV